MKRLFQRTQIPIFFSVFLIAFALPLWDAAMCEALDETPRSQATLIDDDLGDEDSTSLEWGTTADLHLSALFPSLERERVVRGVTCISSGVHIPSLRAPPHTP